MIQLENFKKTTLAAFITSGDTEVTFTSEVFPDPAKGPYWLTIWNSEDYTYASDDPEAENVLITSKSGSNYTMVRGIGDNVAHDHNTAGKTYSVAMTGSMEALTTSSWWDVRAFNAEGDGATDSYEKIQDAIDQAEAGDVVFIPPGEFLCSAKITIDKEGLHLVSHGGSLKESSSLDPILEITANNVTVTGLGIIGAETAGGYTASDDNAAIRCSSVDNVRISGVYCTGKTQTVHLDTCTFCRVEDCHTVGILSTDPGVAVNGTAAYEITGGSHNSIIDCTAKNHGALVLTGSTTQFPTIKGCSGEFFLDNGIYISSAENAVVDSCTLHCKESDAGNGLLPTGIKVRGSFNRVNNCVVKDCGVGYELSPHNLADAYGTAVTGSQAQDCTRGGFRFVGNGSFDPHGFQVQGCHFRNCGSSAYPPISIADGNRHIVSGNVVEGTTDSLCAQIAGNVSNTLYGIHFVSNVLSATCDEGLQVTYAEQCVIANNTFVGQTVRGMDFTNASDNVVVGNNGMALSVQCMRNDANSLRNVVSGNLSGSSAGTDWGEEENYVDFSSNNANPWHSNTGTDATYVGQLLHKNYALKLASKDPGGSFEWIAVGMVEYAGSPETNVEGNGDRRLVYDTSNNDIYIFTGTAGTSTGWKKVTRAT